MAFFFGDTAKKMYTKACVRFFSFSENAIAYVHIYARK